MGHIFAEVTLKNAIDMGKARNGDIREEDVRSIAVKAVVDTGATRLCISEDICQKLGLKIVGSMPVHIANGKRVMYQITEPVEILWKDRPSSSNAIVIPGSDVTLLGVIPLEDLDLMVNPVTQEVVGVHGDERVHMVMTPFED